MLALGATACGGDDGSGPDPAAVEQSAAEKKQERELKRRERELERREQELARRERERERAARQKRERQASAARRKREQQEQTPPPAPEPEQANCEPGYDPCVPPYSQGDVNCPDVSGPINVTGSDPHGLDADGDGTGCE